MAGLTHAPGGEVVKANVPEAPRKHRRKRLPWIMSRDECAVVKAMPNTRCATGLRNRAMLELMHRAGLRVSEICNLRRRDIVWERSLIEIRNAKFGKDRTVSTDPNTMTWLRSWDSRRPRGEHFFNRVKRVHGLKAGERLSTRAVQAMLRLIVARAVSLGKLDPDRAAKITPHKLRHAHATELIEEGASLPAIQQQLGHSNISATSVYLHARPEALRDHMAARPPDLPGPGGAKAG